jgi:hypothetical protein
VKVIKEVREVEEAKKERNAGLRKQRRGRKLQLIAEGGRTDRQVDKKLT